MSKRCSAALLLLLACACTTEGEVLTSLPPRAPVVPRAAAEFIDSIGVSIPPRHYAPSFEQVVLPALSTLGVRHVREWAVVPNGSERAEAQLAALETLAALGIRTHLIFEPRFDVQPEHLAPLADRLGDALESIEGPNDNDANEIDLSADDVVAYMHALRAAIDEAELNGDVQLVDSLDLEPEDKGDLSAILDYGNFERPRDGTLPSPDLEAEKRATRAVSGGKPIMVTECGYATAEGPTGVSEATAAKYLLRLVLGHFMQNIARTYIDELSDGPEDPTVAFMSQGLVHHRRPREARVRGAAAARSRCSTTRAARERRRRSTSWWRTLACPAARAAAEERRPLRARALARRARATTSTRAKSSRSRPIAVRIELQAAAARIAVYEPLHGNRPALEREGVAAIDVQVGDHPAIVMIED